MSLTIRHATEDERTRIATLWGRALSPRTKRLPKGMLDAEGLARSPIPGHRVSPRAYRRMVRLYVTDVVGSGEASVLVAVFPSAPHELVGWVVFSADELHFVRTMAGYGRRGVGRSLVATARKLAPSMVHGYSTPEGRSMMNEKAAAA